MRIYFASSCSSVVHHRCWARCGIRRYLFSFANQKALFKENKVLYDEPLNSIMVDSGAFSVWSKGLSVDIDKYAEFCLRAMSGSRCHLVFVSLDVLPGVFRRAPTREERQESAERSWENYEYLLGKGIPVMPVFHQHEDLRWLERFSRVRYWGVSPANDVSSKERDAWLCKVFSRIPTGVKTHAFGSTGPGILERFPFYSADSSSWLASSLYGTITVWDGRRIRTYSRAEFRANLGAVARHLGACREGYEGVTVVSLQAYLALERYVTDLWSARGVEFREDAEDRVGPQAVVGVDREDAADPS